MLSGTSFVTITQMVLKMKQTHISPTLLSENLWGKTEDSMFKQGFLGSSLRNVGK